jgi:hypothetical protein
MARSLQGQLMSGRERVEVERRTPALKLKRAPWRWAGGRVAAVNGRPKPGLSPTAPGAAATPMETCQW